MEFMRTWVVISVAAVVLVSGIIVGVLMLRPLDPPEPFGDAVPFTLSTVDNDTVNSTDLEEGYLVYFFSTHCTACKSRFDDLQAVQEETDITIMAISAWGDDDVSVREYREDHGLAGDEHWIWAVDPGRVQVDYDADGTPTYIVVNENQELLHRHDGRNWDYDEMEIAALTA